LQIGDAFIVSVLAAIGITKLREFTKIPADSAIALLLSSGLAVGVVLISLSNGFTLDLYSFLFGSILLISIHDMVTSIALCAAVLIVMSIVYRKLMYITFDEEQAKVSGLDVGKLNYLFVVLASITVITSIRLVGVLLISSLIVIPNITAMMFGKGFKKTALISAIVGVFSVLSGITISYVLNLAPGGTIVLISIGTFLATVASKYSIILIKGKGEKLVTSMVDHK
jgi:zinc transport system permease protein